MAAGVAVALLSRTRNGIGHPLRLNIIGTTSTCSQGVPTRDGQGNGPDVGALSPVVAVKAHARQLDVVEASLSFSLLFSLSMPSNSIQSIAVAYRAMTVTEMLWPGSVRSSSTWMVTVGPRALGPGVRVAVPAAGPWWLRPAAASTLPAGARRRR